MVYQPTIPTGLVKFSSDYANIQGNFQQLDTTFGVDHFEYSDATANNGFHYKVTTPDYVENPPTGLPPVTTTNPVLYGFQQFAALGIMQYSRGPSNAVPTPLTKKYSTAAALVLAGGATTNVLDFTGMGLAFCLLFAGDTASPATNRACAFVFWTGAAFNINVLTTGANNLTPQSTGNILQLKNNNAGALNTVYWALDIVRVQ